MNSIVNWQVPSQIQEHYFFAVSSVKIIKNINYENVMTAVSDDNDLLFLYDKARFMTFAEMDDFIRKFESDEERGCIMRLFAAFEGLINYDGLWRGRDNSAKFHSQFKKTAQTAHKGFIKIKDWLNCWDKAANSLNHNNKLKNTISDLKEIYFTERNSLMHNDRTICPPLERIKDKFTDAVDKIISIAPDFKIL